MKAPVAQQMEDWAVHGVQMIWNPGVNAGRRNLNDNVLADWALNNGVLPNPGNSTVCSCFESIFLAAGHSGQARALCIKAILMSLVGSDFSSSALVTGGLRTFHSSSEEHPCLPERGDLVIFGTKCQHVTIATGTTNAQTNETEVLSFGGRQYFQLVPIVRTTVETLQRDPLWQGQCVSFGSPYWHPPGWGVWLKSWFNRNMNACY